MNLFLRALIALALLSGAPAFAASPLVGKAILGPSNPPAVVSYCDDGTGKTALCTYDTIVRGTSTDKGTGTAGTSASTLIAANPTRRGFSVQNQDASATCYINTLATATADYHSLKIAAGTYYETPPTFAPTGAVSIICSAASVSIFAREW